jgi:hypothetical protein
MGKTMITAANSLRNPAVKFEEKLMPGMGFSNLRRPEPNHGQCPHALSFLKSARGGGIRKQHSCHAINATKRLKGHIWF